MIIELIYDGECPNVPATRENLSRALQSANLPSNWTEWEQSRPDVPAYVRGFGSPTVLVNGRDIAGVEPGIESSRCRLYGSVEIGRSGVPSVALIQSALLQEAPLDQSHTAKHNLLAVPGVLFSVLPFGGCPACWPVYGGVLSALGLGFLLSSRYLFPLTALFLGIALFTLAFRASTRHGYGPFAVGLLAAASILCGKFLLESTALPYAGASILIASSVWNSWPRKTAAAQCPNCAPSDTGLIQLSAKEREYESKT